VSWQVEPSGITVLEDLIRLCHERGIRLIFVYSPEYAEVQKLTKNRAEVFDHFYELADRYHVPLWDYSDWRFAADTEYFTNSQHLNAEGAALFSDDVANRMKEYIAAQSRTAPLQASR
jgi:lysophospholipase L1-like esterase